MIAFLAALLTDHNPVPPCPYERRYLLAKESLARAEFRGDKKSVKHWKKETHRTWTQLARL